MAVLESALNIMLERASEKLTKRAPQLANQQKILNHIFV